MARMIEIEPEALVNELKKRGITKAMASVELGYNDTYINDAVRRRKLAASSARTLEILYRIPQDSYKAKPKEIKETVQPEVKETNGPEFDYTKLGKTIYSAVYQAVKKAWSE